MGGTDYSREARMGPAEDKIVGRKLAQHNREARMGPADDQIVGRKLAKHLQTNM